jgi:hypothetical protein
MGESVSKHSPPGAGLGGKGKRDLDHQEYGKGAR